MGGKAVFWLLSLLALMMRLVMTAPSPGIVPDDALDVLTQLSVLCDSTPLPGSDKHPPTSLADADLVLTGLLDGQEMALAGNVLHTGSILYGVMARFWCFPPVRGPPLYCLGTRFAQGPPVFS